MNQCIIDRLIEKKPPTHAAYRQERSTTEGVFAAKFLTERAVTSKDHPICLLLLNMNKAVEAVDRQVPLNNLERIINTDESQVQCENSMSDIFATNARVLQRDGTSTNEFTFYLAQALEKEHRDHSCAKAHFVSQVILQDHCYDLTPMMSIDQQKSDKIMIK